MATIPTKTHAVRLLEHGGPEQLVPGEYDLPPLGGRDAETSPDLVGRIVVLPWG